MWEDVVYRQCLHVVKGQVTTSEHACGYVKVNFKMASLLSVCISVFAICRLSAAFVPASLTDPGEQNQCIW